MVDKLHIHDFAKVKKIVEQTAQKYWGRNYKVSQYVFGTVEDARQVCWVRLFESKTARQIISEDIGESGGLISIIAKRGMQDYVRSTLGRNGHANNSKACYTTYYMDYYNTGENDIVDLPLADLRVSVEDAVIEKKLYEELMDFINNKLSRQERMVMNYIYKDGQKMKKIGRDLFSVTESRISQIKRKALDKLRKQYEKV